MPFEETTMAVAAAAGSAATTLVNRLPISGLQKIGEFVVGAMVGIAAGPAATTYFNVADEHYRIAIGFACGSAGLAAFTLFQDWIRGGSFKEWIWRFIGAPKPPASS
jgi:hypothetical protein